MNVGTIVWSEDRILMVRQQGSDDAEPCWTLPGGGVDAGETVLQAAARETLEETGIVVSACGRLVYVMEYAMSSEHSPGGLSLVFEVSEWSGQPCVSEEGILEARFVPIPEAISLFERHLKIPRMRDPVVAFLRGEVGYGAYWVYARDEAGEEYVLSRSMGNHVQ
jgi:8-oxo-dGTP pyrophosphatase MutT (NUDIX family)